jgi:hypothetical protein
MKLASLEAKDAIPFAISIVLPIVLKGVILANRWLLGFEFPVSYALSAVRIEPTLYFGIHNNNN